MSDIPISRATQAHIIEFMQSTNKAGARAAIEALFENVAVANNLTTDEAATALSAAQGVVMKALLDALSTQLTTLSNTSAAQTDVATLQNDVAELQAEMDEQQIKTNVSDEDLDTAAERVAKLNQIMSDAENLAIVDIAGLEIALANINTALAGKADAGHTHTAAEVGLGNVDNTSDADKQISTATQTALNGKADAGHTHTAEELGITGSDGGALDASFQLPLLSERIKDLNNSANQGVTFNHVTIMAFGDSLGSRAYSNISDVMINELSCAGIGFDSVQYNITTGTGALPTANVQRRSDLWGSGRCMLLNDGAVLEFGGLFGGATIVPFNCTDLSLYFVSESGGGSVTIEQSLDNGGVWSVLDSAITTDSTATAALIKKYDFSEGTRIFRLTVSGGDVEFIGALIRNEKHKGFVDCISASGGNPLSSFVQGDASVLNAVLADVNPQLVMSHYYEDNANVVTHFDTYADLIQAASPGADHMYMAEHEQDDTKQKELENNPVYRAKSDLLPRLQIWETGQVYQSWENAEDLGWTTDPIHYTDAAWRFQASRILQYFGLSGSPSLKILATYQDGQNEAYRIEPATPTKNSILEFFGDEASDVTFRFGWDEEGETNISAERYWDIKRHSSTDAISSEGLQLIRNTSSGYGTVSTYDKLGRCYHGVSNTTTLLPVFGAKDFFHESSTGKAAVAARHFTGTQNAFVTYEGFDSSNPTARVLANGTARFMTLDVQDWVTADDDTAAATAGVDVNQTYKTSTGELRFRIS